LKLLELLKTPKMEKFGNGPTIQIKEVNNEITPPNELAFRFIIKDIVHNSDKGYKAGQ
jgi:hypothetical protein